MPEKIDVYHQVNRLNKGGTNVLKPEMDIAYFHWIHRPGQMLGVLDNETDYAECKRRVHCNCSHDRIAPQIVYDAATAQYQLDETDLEQNMRRINAMQTGRRHMIFGCAEHNNVYFPSFRQYKETLPQALMQDPNGHYLELKDILIENGAGIPMPAIDDPTLIGLNARSSAKQAAMLKDSQYVSAYVLGSEMLYPEYFHLGLGDFRPASWAHFAAWCRKQGFEPPAKEEVLSRSSSNARYLWLQYREQAMADRAAIYYMAILSEDPHHLAYYPTHGSAMVGTNRSQLSQQPDTLACACDGMEMGHILIDNDRERRNPLLISHFTAYGAPVIVPRLGNKTVDLSAIGGGRSFTPVMLRRLVYECIGMGISTVFPIHWSRRLHDGEWFIKDTPAEPTCREVLYELTAASPFLNGMGRLQPQIGLFASDATWLNGWNPAWTGVLQDALSAHASITLVTDALIDKFLASKMPALICVDNEKIFSSTLPRLKEYLETGGHLFLAGSFALADESGAKPEISSILSHANAHWLPSESFGEPRVLRELFLAGPRFGISGIRQEYRPLSLQALFQAIEQHVQGCVIRPVEILAEQDATQINVYSLTDRASMLFVLINNAPTATRFTLAPNPALLREPLFWDAITGLPVDASMELAGHATRMLWACEKSLVAKDESYIASAEKAFERWDAMGFNVDALRTDYACMRTGAHMPRRCAFAQAIQQSIALKPSIVIEENGVSIHCEAMDATGEAVPDATITLRITPGTFDRFALHGSQGSYHLYLDNALLPTIYDVDACTYRPLKGACRFIFQAEAKEKLGGCAICVHL